MLSLIIGVTNMIPYFGPFLGGIPAVIITLLISPIHGVWVGLFILALQQFDGNFLGPKILGNSLDISPLWIILAVVVGGAVMGPLGMFIGVPIFATIKMFCTDYINRKYDKNIRLRQPSVHLMQSRNRKAELCRQHKWNMELSGGERASFPCTGSFLFKEEFYGTTHKPILFVRISLLHAWLYHTGAFADKLSGSAFRLGKHHPTVFGIHSHAGHLCKDREGFGEGMFFPQTAELENALLCLGIAYCALPFISMIVVLTSPLQPNLVEQAMGELNDSSLFSMLFVIAVQPAVFEELLFRGAALHGYRSLGAKKRC